MENQPLERRDSDLLQLARRLTRRVTHKGRWFWPLAIALLVADCATKRVVEEHLAVGQPRPVVGEVVRFTLSYNNAAAMGISLGGNSRLLLTLLSVMALGVLVVLYHRTLPSERLRTIGVALVIGGAVGNLIDRLRSSTGVVDFIDVGVNNVRFWTFNLADVGITVGALLLLMALGRWRPSRARRELS
jgi:signal peptidase II